jgi:hypothetical protein
MAPRLLEIIDVKICQEAPDPWIEWNLYVNSSILKYLNALYLSISDRSLFRPNSREEKPLWGFLLSISVKFLLSPLIGQNSLSLQKQRYVYKNQPNLRTDIYSFIRRIIVGINKYRDYINTEMRFPTGYLNELVKLCIEDKYSQKWAFDLIALSLKEEYAFNSNIKELQGIFYSQIHDCFYRERSVFNGLMIDEIFIMHSLENFISKESFDTGGALLIKNLKKFIPMMVDQDAILKDDDSVNSILKILRFLKSIEHKYLFVMYIHKLYQFHLGQQNYVEAAITLMQESQLIGWSQNVKSISHQASNISNITEFELNEQIHLTCIRLFDLGNCWERAIELCKVLEKKYETEYLDFKKLGEILKIRVSFHEKILGARPYSTYFRVSFHGGGFSNYLNGKEYIYRADAWEKLDSFCNRFEEQYRPIQFDFSSNFTPPDNIKDSNIRIVHVNPVEPVPDIRNWSKSTEEFDKSSGIIGQISWDINRKKHLDVNNAPLWIFCPELFWDKPAIQVAFQLKDRLPDELNEYYEKNEICMYSLIRKYREYPPSPNSDDIANLWTERTIFFTENALPNISRRSRIQQILCFKVSPIENAIIAVRQKTLELIKLLSKCEDRLCDSTEWKPDSSNTFDTYSSIHSGVTAQKSLVVGQFTMALTGTVDSPVNGGIQNYRSAFLENENFANDSNTSAREDLKQVILEQVRFL